MKAILVPTDYSSTSHQVIDYAAQLALQTKARLVLYHAFFEPYAVTEAPVQLPTRAELEAEHQVKLQNIGEKIKWQYQIEVDYATSPLPLAEGLTRLVPELQAGLVVMGVRAAHAWERALFGSNTAVAIRKAIFPVLIIPEQVHFKPYQSILFACDYAALTPATDLLLLQELAARLQSQVQILYLENFASQKGSVDKKYSSAHLDDLLKDVDHNYVQLEAEDVVEGIEKGIKQCKPDLLVMAPHKHNFWDSILNKSNTRRMAFQTNIPLLAIPLKEE